MTKKDDINNTCLHSLNMVGSIKFSERELDVLACLLHNNSNKKIASLLSISYRTIEVYVYNIMKKIGYNSREQLINVVVKSNEFYLLRERYSTLLKETIFLRQLKNISKIINLKPHFRYFYAENLSNEEEKLLGKLAGHLILIDIKFTYQQYFDETSLKNLNSIPILPQTLLPHSALEKRYFLLSNDKLLFSDYKKLKYIDFRDNNSYYFIVLDFLEQTIQIDKLTILIKEFKTEYQLLNKQLEDENIAVSNLTIITQEIQNKGILAFKKNIFLLISTMFILAFILHLYTSNKLSNNNNVRFNFPLPNQYMLLERPEIISKIDKKLKDNTGIGVVALIGPGGSGKTILSYLYASKHKGNITWELNAETKEKLFDSFEALITVLAKKKEEKLDLKTIQETIDPDNKKEKLLFIITKYLRDNPNWLLIFNNVETFQDIKDFFPYDKKLWGEGSVIITTRNANIVNNNIDDSHVIFTENLNSTEQFDLFLQVLSSGHSSQYLLSQKQEIQNFLKFIPPFPLDIITVAHYIRETGVSYKDYLTFKNENIKDLSRIEEEIIKEKNNYTKSRYSIITLSLDQIIANNPDFKDLLIFISLLDFQSIPRSLLTIYKDRTIVQNFLFNLKKYSLIAEDNNNENKSSSSFSVHRSTQIIIHNYLDQLFNLTTNKKIIEKMAAAIEQYIDHLSENEEINLIKQITPHVQAFLDKGRVDDIKKADLLSKLGHIYWNVYFDGKKAENILKQALNIYENHPEISPYHKAYALSQLGIAYKLQGNYKSAKKSLEESLDIYKSHSINNNNKQLSWVLLNLVALYKKNNIEKALDYAQSGFLLCQKCYKKNDLKYAWALRVLGDVHRYLGDYKNAIIMLEEVIGIYQNNNIQNKIEYADIIAHLGCVYRHIGDYKKSQKLLQESIKVYGEVLEKDHIEIAWVNVQLGFTYGLSGNWEKAKKLIEHSLDIYNKHYGSNHEETAWVLEKLAVVYRELKYYSKSSALFNKSLELYQKYYTKEDSIQIALLLNNIGQLKILEGNLEAAEPLLNEAYTIFKDKKTPKIYRVLEALLELNYKKWLHTKKANDLKQNNVYYNKAIKLQEELHNLIRENFPINAQYTLKFPALL